MMNALRHSAILILTLLLAACAGAPRAVEPTVKPDSNGVTDAQDPPLPTPAPVTPGGTLTRALTAEPAGLDPAGAQGAGQNEVLPYLFDTLVTQDFENNIVPLLAETWEVSEDTTRISFRLKDGLTFHDGTTLDAGAVVASFERLRDPALASPMAASLTGVSTIEALDARTVRFLFAEPSATFLAAVTTPYAGIVSPTAAVAAGEQFARQPVGSGPFQLKSWEPGVALTLERNEAYRWAAPMAKNRGAPYIATLVFLVMPDAAVQLAAFRAGQVDMLVVDQPDQITSMRADPNVTLEPVSLNGLVYLGFNCAKAPFDDVRVRQALSHAIDKPALVAGALGGEGEPAYAPLATTLLGFDVQLQPGELGYDQAKSEALLAAAGLVKGQDAVWTKDGAPMSLTLLTLSRTPYEAVASVVQAQLEAVGVPVTIKRLDAPAAGEAALAGDYDLLLWRYDGNDPDVLNASLHSQRMGSTNLVFYSNPEVDSQIGRAHV